MIKFDEVVANYILLRDAKKEMTREHELALKPIEEAMDLAEQEMLGELNKMGVSSLRTVHGTIMKAKKTSVSTSNWDAVWDFIRSNELWHFVEHRVNKTAVEGYINEHGEPPPGVNVSSIYVVQFRR